MINVRTISLLVLLLAVACAKDIVTGKKTLNYYNMKDEPKLGQEVLVAQVKELKRKKIAVDSEKNRQELERIRTIVKRVAKVSHYPHFPYEAHLSDIDVVNAWCAPGGKIMVFAGLWDKEEGLVEEGNDDELAAVLGHEIAHATARHVTESISRNMTLVLAGTAAQSVIAAGSAEGADLFGQIFTEGFSVFVPSYSRQNELEADRLGLFYIARAGYDPRAAVRLWEKAAKRHRNEPTSIYASHPKSGERAEQLKHYLPEALKIYEAALTNRELETMQSTLGEPPR